MLPPPKYSDNENFQIYSIYSVLSSGGWAVTRLGGVAWGMHSQQFYTYCTYYTVIVLVAGHAYTGETRIYTCTAVSSRSLGSVRQSVGAFVNIQICVTAVARR